MNYTESTNEVYLDIDLIHCRWNVTGHTTYMLVVFSTQ